MELRMTNSVNWVLVIYLEKKKPVLSKINQRISNQILQTINIYFAKLWSVTDHRHKIPNRNDKWFTYIRFFRCFFPFVQIDNVVCKWNNLYNVCEFLKHGMNSVISHSHKFSNDMDGDDEIPW